MSESNECISEVPVAKKEQAKLKTVKDKGNKLGFFGRRLQSFGISMLLVWFSKELLAAVIPLQQLTPHRFLVYCRERCEVL